MHAGPEEVTRASCNQREREKKHLRIPEGKMEDRKLAFLTTHTQI